MKTLMLTWRIGMALAVALSISTATRAATSFSNSLTGFTGDSTQTATQNALAAAGFNVFSTEATPVIQFDANGANFGAVSPGDDGRNYMRTNDSDYATVSHTAEVTIVVPNQEMQDAFFGMGAGDTALFGWPDWSTQFSSVILTPEVNDGTGLFTTMFTDNDMPVFANNAIAMSGGTHRLRLTSFAQLAVYSIDLNYAGGTFVEDYRAPVLNLSALFDDVDGWPAEPSRIFFGGDDGTIFKDFQVTTSGPQGKFGDLDGDGLINTADWVIFRTNQETDLTNLSMMAAYLRGDFDLDLDNDYADFKSFQAVYDENNGAGSFVAMLAGVPEPSTLALISFFALFMLPATRRITSRHST